MGLSIFVEIENHQYYYNIILCIKQSTYTIEFELYGDDFVSRLKTLIYNILRSHKWDRICLRSIPPELLSSTVYLHPTRAS